MTNRLQTYLPFIIYFLTLSIYACFTWVNIPEFFGFNTLRYTPDNKGLTHLLIAVMFPFVIRPSNIKKYLEASPHNPDHDYTKYLLAFIGVWTLAFGILFVWFRCQYFFLGDSYTILAEFSKSDTLIKYREYGSYLLQFGLRDLLGEPSIETSLLSFRISSIASGILFLVSLTWITLYLFKNFFDQLKFWFGLVSGGYMLLFFGYVEFYNWLILAVLIFSLVGMLICQNKINKWVILIPLLLAIFFHSLGLVLIPSAIYLILKNQTSERFISRLSFWKKILITVLVFCAAYLAITLFANYNTYLKFAFLPLTSNIITINNYTLFSPAHLFDFLNLLFLLFPGLALALLFLFIKEKVKPSPTLRFLVILALSSLFAIFIIDPKLGMPRDWDLLSIAGVPLTLFVFYYGIKLIKSNPGFAHTIPLMIMLNFLSLGSRVLSQTDATVAETQFKDYLRLEPVKSRNGHLILIDYYEQKGDLVKAARESAYRKTLYPQEELLKKAMGLVEQKRYVPAQKIINQAIEIDPQYWNLWLSLGSVYINQKKFDSAFITLEIADGLNPHSAEVKAQLGEVYFNQQNFDKAEKLWLEALELNSTKLQALMGLATIYHQQNNMPDHIAYLTRAALCEDANYGIVANLADYYISIGDFRKATRLYDRALAMGLDSTAYYQIIEKHPELVR